MKIIPFLHVISVFSWCREKLTFTERLTQNEKKKRKKKNYQIRELFVLKELTLLLP